LVFDDPERPEANNLLTIYQLCSGASREAVAAECASMRWSQFKPLLSDAVVEHLRPLQAKYKELTNEPQFLDSVLAKGASTASEVAQRTVEDVRDALGYLPRPRL
jgi:tryptophanyl-tRNA synthetase